MVRDVCGDWYETVVRGSRVQKGCCGGWSETPSDRIVDGIGTLCIRSGGSVAGFSGMFGKVRCGENQIRVTDTTFRDKDQVGHQDCLQSRQDHIIAVRERRDTSREEDSPGDAEAHGVCGVTRQGVLVW